MNSPEDTTTELGKLLQNARLKASLSVEEIAMQLNLGVATVRNIENNLDKLIEEKQIPSIYLRGYIANYAKLVALEELEQFSQYKQLLSRQVNIAKPISPIRKTVKKKRSKLLSFFIILLLIIAGLFALQYFSHGKYDVMKPINALLTSSNTPLSTDAVVSPASGTNSEQSKNQ